MAWAVCFFIIAEIFLRVLDAAQTRIEFDGHILAGVIVPHGDLTVALMQRPEVRLQQFAIQAQRIGLGRLAQFLSLRAACLRTARSYILRTALYSSRLFLAQALGTVLGA